MDNFEDYIYLILIIIAAIGGLLGKKKKTESSKQAKPTSAKPQWEELMRQLQENPDKGQQIEPEPSTETITEPIAQKQTGVRIQIPVEETPITEAVKETTADEWNLDSPEAAKRAFVYSEIFTRKYVEMK